MLDGQGCLLPVRHFHTEDSPLMLSSWATRYTTCRAEAAESNPNSNTNPHPHHSRSTQACPCSPAAELERESNDGELLDLNISHCSPVPFGETDAAQTCHSNEELAEEGLIPCTSLQYDDCSSTSPRRSGLAFSFLPVQEVEAGTLQTRSSNGGLEGVRSSHCVSSDFDFLSSEFGRSVQEEGTYIKVLDGREMHMELSSSVITEEEGLSRNEDCRRDAERGEQTVCLCKWEDVEAPGNKERFTGVEYPGMLRQISRCLDNSENFLGLACAVQTCTNSKETDESTSETANAEKILITRSSSAYSTTQCDSFEYPGVKGCKKVRIINGSETSHDILSGRCANRTMACNLGEEHTSQQQPYLPGLDNESALRCLAFVPLSDLGRLSRVGRQYRDLVKSRLILQLRRTYGMLEHLVFIYTSGPGGWTAYDANRNVWRTLPSANVDPAFDLSDRESLSAGTHVLWLGKEMFQFVYYRYDLLTNSWERGPSMINPRCLFASASCGEFAFVAGGFGPADSTGALSLLNSAERYNSLSGEWEHLPPMSTPRHKCSGFFMDGKFYVIGGRDINHQPIMSGEEYNPNTGVWRTIPNMYFAPEICRRDMFEPSPPLVAVVNNQLYAVENTTNALKIYNKLNNTWSNLGYLPVPADLRNGWGVAFKALGDRLFVMGDVEGIAACCWQPGPNATEPVWQLLSHRERGVDSFLYNCAVMAC